jgi:hypothetical protein
MKKTQQIIRLITALIISLFLIVACSQLNSTSIVQKSLGSAAIFQQATPTHPVEDKSVPGTTDGIVIMGFLIVVIVIAPILIKRKTWLKK